MLLCFICYNAIVFVNSFFYRLIGFTVYTRPIANALNSNKYFVDNTECTLHLLLTTPKHDREYIVTFPRTQALIYYRVHRERSHITSSAEGGGGFQKMTLDDGGEGGLWSDDVIQNRSISGFFIS